MINLVTPVESYPVGGRVIRVKRDDLAGTYPAPPLGKLRGIATQVSRNLSPGSVLGVVDRSPASRNSWAHSYLAREFGARCVAYGAGDGIYQRIAKSLGAEYRIVAGETPEDVYTEAVRDFRLSFPGGYIADDDCHTPEIVEDTRREALATDMRCDTLVIPTGSGGLALGILRGLNLLGRTPSCVILHTAGSRRSEAYLREVLERGGVSDSLMTAVRFEREGAEAYCPFPANPKYELPAWGWVAKGGGTGEVLFWNAGG